MPVAFSLYLDLLRFAAALAVFFAHLNGQPFTKDVLWWRATLYGDLAVMLFFVMSGYVIAYVTAVREKDATSYFSSRASRMLSVSIAALLLTFLFDSIGMTLRPDFYALHWVLDKPPSWTGYIASLLFVNEYQIFEFGGIVAGSNGPYWSLSFEVTYYVVAGLMLFSRRALAWPLIALIFLLAGRTITALFPLWLLGFLAYRMRGPQGWAAQLVLWGAAAILICSPSIGALLPNSANYTDMPWGRGPFNRNLFNDYFFALVFTAHLLAARSLLSKGNAFLQKSTRTLRWLGSLTFPLYLLHYPVICLVAALSPWGQESLARAALISAVTALFVIGLTPVCEKFRVVLRRWTRLEQRVLVAGAKSNTR